MSNPSLMTQLGRALRNGHTTRAIDVFHDLQVEAAKKVAVALTDAEDIHRSVLKSSTDHHAEQMSLAVEAARRTIIAEEARHADAVERIYAAHKRDVDELEKNREAGATLIHSQHVERLANVRELCSQTTGHNFVPSDDGQRCEFCKLARMGTEQEPTA